MRAKVAEMHTAGDWSTNKIFGMKRKTVPFGSIASFSMKESNKPSISSAIIIMNSKSEFHQAPIVRVIVSSGLELEQGEEAPQRGRGRGAGRGRGKAGSGVGRGAGGERQMRGRPGS